MLWINTTNQQSRLNFNQWNGNSDRTQVLAACGYVERSLNSSRTLDGFLDDFRILKGHCTV